MPGIRFTIPSPVQQVADDFNRANGALTGSTPTGARPWQIIGAGTVVPGIAANALKAISGTGNRLAVVALGRPNYDLQYRIASARAGTVIHGVAMQATDENDFVALNHRASETQASYVIARRRAGVVYPILDTGVAPKAGDYVHVRVRDGKNFTLTVNGMNLGTAVVDGWEAKSLAGFFLNGADTETSFDDFAAFVR